MSKDKKKRNKGGDTREFTAVRTSACKNDACDEKQHAEKMKLSDREMKPGFEV